MVTQWRKHGGGPGSKSLPLTTGKKMKTSLFGTIRFFFSHRVCQKCYHVFLCYPNCLYNSRNFHCDAIIPVVKRFWCVALEPMTDSKGKPGQGQWTLLKMEPCCDGIKRLFSTAVAGHCGQDNVLAQKAFLEENGCNAGR